VIVMEGQGGSVKCPQEPLPFLLDRKNAIGRVVVLSGILLQSVRRLRVELAVLVFFLFLFVRVLFGRGQIGLDPGVPIDRLKA
jgi:hypothetical protein